MWDKRPYFMKKKEWYYRDPDDGERGLKLTDKAPPKARESYEKCYAALDDDGIDKD